MELRKHYFLDKWVIVSKRRGERPYEFKKHDEAVASYDCFFCPGNEDKTPPEIGRLEKNGKWYVRWFANKFPFVAKQGEKKIKTHGLFTFSNAYGEHEVIVEDPDHSKQFHDLSVEHIKDILEVYSSRIEKLDEKSRYVVVFKNHGKNAGTSLVHSHTQIVSVNTVPVDVRGEVKKSFRNGKCLFCEIIGIEKKSDRSVFENNDFVAFCPYASRFNYEIWIFPKQHIKSITEMNDSMLLALADVLKKILVKLSEINAAYNFVLHYAPKRKDLHFHIEVMPRIATWGGFEHGSGIVVNQVMPEDAARFYREEED